MSDCISFRFVSDRASECFLVCNGTIVPGTEMAELWTARQNSTKNILYILPVATSMLPVHILYFRAITTGTRYLGADHTGSYM